MEERRGTMTLTGTITKKLAILAVAVAGLGIGLVATTEQASAATQGSWYWSETLLKHRLKNNDINWNNGTYTEVVDARCSGRGGYILNDYGTEKLFQRFVCAARAADGSVFTVRVHVSNRYHFTVRYLG